MATQPNEAKADTPAVTNGADTQSNAVESAQYSDDSGVHESFDVCNGKQEEAQGGFPLQVAGSKKKRSGKGRSGANRGPTGMPKFRGTGFEEYFCDPPMTPAEYAEEKENVYAPHLPFFVRIEACIQRFRARRRMDSGKNNFFDSYLLLGGIDSSQRQFQSTTQIDDEDLEGSSQDHIRAMTANDVILRGASTDERHFNPNEDEHWDVDFTGVVSGFLGEWLPKAVGGAPELIQEAISVAQNFLKYVVQHEVCPEYADDLENALAVCQKAKTELPMVTTLRGLVPGAFSLHCRAAFCSGGKPGQQEPDTYDNYRTYGMDPNKNMRAASAHIAMWLGNVVLVKMVRDWPVRAIHTAEQGFEIIPIPDSEYPDNEKINGMVFPNAKQRGRYAALTGPDILGNYVREKPLKPCGVFRVKPAKIEDGWDRGEQTCPSWINETEDFITEVTHLQNMEPGMKLRMIVCELSCGIKIIKEVVSVYPTFHVFLPQELMAKYKHPMLNERPGPSMDDPEREDEQYKEQYKDDFK